MRFLRVYASVGKLVNEPPFWARPTHQRWVAHQAAQRRLCRSVPDPPPNERRPDELLHWRGCPPTVPTKRLSYLHDVPEGAAHSMEPASEKGWLGDQRGSLTGCTKGGLNIKLNSVTDAKGRPLKFFSTAGQVTNYSGPALPGNLPSNELMIAKRGYKAVPLMKRSIKTRSLGTYQALPHPNRSHLILNHHTLGHVRRQWSPCL
jgi:hypothetical protein